MARGWESKSVEQQQEEMAEQRKSFREKNGSLVSPTPSPKEQKRNRKREGLLLSRGRLRQQLQTASHPRHREMLEQAIAELDRQLSSFEQVLDPTSPK
jgi:predicted component of type VI protein secretion system